MFDLSNLKICYIAGTLGQGGAERQLFYAIQALRQSRAAVRVLSFDQGGFWETPIRNLGANVVCVGPDRSRFKRVCRIVKQLKKEPADVLQSQHFYTNVYTCLGAFLVNCKAIGALRSNGHFDLSQSGRLGGRINLHLPRTIAANSRSSIQYAIKHRVPASRLFFLPNVVDTERFKPAPRPPNNPVTLLAVGRLTREKRFDRFISLLHQLRANCSLDVRGWLVGPTRSDQDLRPALESQAARIGLRSDVLQFLGSTSDMSAIYQQADIFVLTSEHEGTPNVLLEAMAAGLPVVATRVGGVPEIVQHGRTGFLVDEHRTGDLLKVTSELIQNRGLRRESGTQARSHVEVTHSLHLLPRYLAALYDLALGKRLGHARHYAPANEIVSAPMLHLAFRRSNDHESTV
jgi:glycosyltransferase involved in cell wall biosynthesis